MKFKRIVPVLCLTAFIPLLTSCRVNWFDRQYDVPWYYVAIPVAIYCAIVWIIAHMYIMSGTYICPQCYTEIKLKWYQISAYVHLNGERLVKCPNCKRKSFCKRKRRNK